MRLPRLTLVIGFAASGKSAFAERLAHQSELAKVYVATAEPHDDEMAEKIAAHKSERFGFGWRTIEEPRYLAQELTTLEAGEVGLVDCATLWLSNHMIAENDLDDELDVLCEVLEQMPTPVIIVSNELGGGVVPANPMARRFQSTHGRMNQLLAAHSDLVVQVTAGIPVVLKGGSLLEHGFDPEWV